MFSRILIANRGEIALRIIRACRELGVQCVVVYSEADRHAHYLSLADEAICIGPADPAESYLNIPRIISAAEISNVEAIHPGYGFLAENAHFVEICRDCKINFIGPAPESMHLLGDKVQARKLAEKSKVAVVPGSDKAVANEDEAAQLAEKIGYPVIIKAAAGGGGRGMRIAHNEMSLRVAFHSAETEASSAFKNADLYLEKYLEQSRHVEVQVLADHTGNTLHLWERDCSLQRRHQKLVEETPSPGLSTEVRQELCKAAVRLAKAAGYINAGTFEFLLDKNNKFYFSEANTRIQVEHPITEMVTGIDLVQWQLRIAAGENLKLRQKDIRQQGSAIECRINAEDPANDFAPCSGCIDRFIPPGGFGVRLDSHVYPGYRISPHYDSLIGKLVVHKKTRAEAIACMKRALQEFEVGPVKTTIGLCREILTHRQFVKGKVDTGFIERTW
ncbi:MAG: acetyl-CoA carboxylase biotin carboxylase subunit [Phycisphaerae bacterium SM23_30]|nr:MAG: acetyl-CoA carboxylase biotin carboxylase subunit [Phycisphaerae bacterium SM23_30]